jgi:hypothetical protein
MRTRLKLLRVVLLAGVIAVSLAFGANEAMGCLTCTQPPPTACQHKDNPNGFCAWLCEEVYDCENGGMCMPPDYCVCLEK